MPSLRLSKVNAGGREETHAPRLPANRRDYGLGATMSAATGRSRERENASTIVRSVSTEGVYPDHAVHHERAVPERRTRQGPVGRPAVEDERGTDQPGAAGLLLLVPVAAYDL
jgi:hypothetical protein